MRARSPFVTPSAGDRAAVAAGIHHGPGRRSRLRRADEGYIAVRGSGESLGMLKGTLLAESPALGTALEVDGLQAALIVRRDVSSLVTNDQPRVWTFIEFQAQEGL